MFFAPARFSSAPFGYLAAHVILNVGGAGWSAILWRKAASIPPFG
jgi:hypothetical protein